MPVNRKLLPFADVVIRRYFVRVSILSFMHPAILIDDFVKSEEAKMTRLDKLFWNYPKVSTTGAMAGSFQHMQLGRETIIKPSVWNRFPALFFLFIAGIIWIGLLGMLLESRSPFAFLLLFFALLTYLIYYLLNISFFSRRDIYTIIINSEGINIDYKLFAWTDIVESCILTKKKDEQSIVI